MKTALIALAIAWALAAGSPATAQDVERAPTPDWVAPPPAIKTQPTSSDAPIQILFADHQARFEPDRVRSYYFRRTRVQTEQGLDYVSTVNAVWSPPQETVQVHAVRIIRGDQVIDVLKDQDFQTLRRENNLESSVLDGQLTATLQPRGLRVGDILETAFSIHDSGGVLAPHAEAIFNARNGFTLAHYRLRAIWPGDRAIKVVASAPWSDARPRRLGADWVYEIESRDLPPEQLPDNLPGRFYMTRTVQFTDFTDWSQASSALTPFFERSATLEPGSSLQSEIDRIRAAHVTPEARAAAALRLVQDEVRYVALLLGEGGYVPIPADEVWRSRYGDCKGKTVLLLALLRGLGIEAEAALVSTANGDGLPDRQPLIAWFDHVLVRAVVNGRVYWLDGTSAGDRSLAELTAPPYRWALPLRAERASLVEIEQPPLSQPTQEMLIEVDASAGLDAEAPVISTVLHRGPLARQLRSQVASLPADQLKALLTSAMNDERGIFKLESSDTRYEDDTNTFHIIFRGRTRLSWVESGGSRFMGVPEATITLPHQEEREGLAAGFKDAPYAVTHPYLVRATYRIKLPDEGRGFRLEGGDQTVQAGGYRLQRRAKLEAGTAEISISTTSLTPELSAAEMAESRTRAETFVDSGVRIRAPATYVATAADRSRLDPGQDSGSDLIKRAEALWDIGDLKGAVALLDAAVAREPGNAKALRTRGAVRLEQMDYKGAREDYDQAVELDPADVEALVGQGLVASEDGRHADAVVSYSVALRLDPSHVTALSGRGAAYHQLGRWERSLADYRALKTSSDYTDTALFGELRALQRLKRTAEARTLIRLELEKEPTHYVALAALVDLSWREGQFTEAAAALEKALAASPDSFDHLSLRSEVRIRAGDAAGGRADLDAMRRLAAADPLLMNNVCWNQAITGFDLERAITDCEAALAADEAAVIDSRALVLLGLGRHAEAKAAYDQALAAAPNQAPSLFGRGLARLALGDAEGRRDIERARALDVDVGDNFVVLLQRQPELTP